MWIIDVDFSFSENRDAKQIVPTFLLHGTYDILKNLLFWRYTLAYYNLIEYCILRNPSKLSHTCMQMKKKCFFEHRTQNRKGWFNINISVRITRKRNAISLTTTAPTWFSVHERIWITAHVFWNLLHKSKSAG